MQLCVGFCLVFVEGYVVKKKMMILRFDEDS